MGASMPLSGSTALPMTYLPSSIRRTSASVDAPPLTEAAGRTGRKNRSRLRRIGRPSSS